VLVERLELLGVRDRLPAVPGDAENDQRDDETDQQICALEHDRDRNGARGDPEADEAVDAGVLGIGD
jgi:hypothetical protein